MTSRLVPPNIRWLRDTRAVTSHAVVLEEPHLHSDFARATGAKNPDDTAAEAHLPFMQTTGDHLQRIFFGNHSKLDRIRRRK